MNINLSNLIKKEFWMDLNPSIDSRLLKYYLIIFSGLAIIGAIFLLTKFVYPKVRKMLGIFFATAGLLGLLLVSFRFEGIYLLSSRIIFAIFLLILFGWLIFIIKYLLLNLPKELASMAEYQKFYSYIPKKKK